MFRDYSYSPKSIACFDEPTRELTMRTLKDRAVPTQFELFPGTQHGFAVRGSEEDATVAAAKQRAAELTSVFFRKHLA